MDLIQSVLMGIVQGLSEFLPISSSAHLVFTSSAYKLYKGAEIIQHTNQEIFLEIMLHLGTLFAVLFFFKKDILRIFRSFYFGIKNKDYDNVDFKLGLYIVVGTIITVLIAFPLTSVAEKLVFLPAIVGALLIFTGVLLLYSEYYYKKFNNKNELSLKRVIFIGMAQGLASLPGFSRSGLTIAIAMLMGMDRERAARYSFLLSIPIIVGASIAYPVLKIDLQEIITYNWGSIIAGTFVSGVVGYFCIKYFLKFLNKFSLSIFGYYCIFIGIVALMVFSRGV
ncbi:undecaprenyl-diphosphate phosphatase [bacterium]|nr:undecaprenyl-diphosphate phosphatase [bacterium]